MRELFDKIDSKKMIGIMGILVGVVLVFIVLNMVGTSLFAKSSYEDVEKIMQDATIKYLENNKDKVPKEINGTVVVNDGDLIDGEYMKDIYRYTKNKKVTCSGYVNVTNINGNYRYTPFLDCGNAYKTVALVDYIKEHDLVVESGSGLYSEGNQLVYKGESINNYAKMNNKKYRIVKIVDDHIVLIYDENPSAMAWDDRYNIDKKINIGINDYSISRVYEYLQQLYDGNELFTEKDKLLLTSFDVKVGKRKSADSDKMNGLEGANILSDQYISLLTVSDFLNASLDSNCVSSESKSCVNYNYFMDLKYSFWTVTGDADTSYKVFKIDSGLGALLTNASSSSSVLPVVQLAKDAVYVDGDGSKNNPYTFK